ncbi:hypothetical protein OHA70_14815 [Kribbella sp. NBC_00382]|uniref:hypothetical protein n=1 Tax=Kribbella sp. NBC_00382 TaxID=2975967 RepID=UPI002E1B9D8B
MGGRREHLVAQDSAFADVPPALAETTTERICRSGAELGPLFDLIDPRVWYLADFLTPPQQTPVPDLATDLSALRRVPADQVRADLDVLA